MALLDAVTQAEPQRSAMTPMEMTASAPRNMTRPGLASPNELVASGTPSFRAAFNAGVGRPVVNREVFCCLVSPGVVGSTVVVGSAVVVVRLDMAVSGETVRPSGYRCIT